MAIQRNKRRRQQPPTPRTDDDAGSISSDDDENLPAPPSDDEEDDFFAQETPDEKRVRLAKAYLAELDTARGKQEADDAQSTASADDDEDDIDRMLNEELKVKSKRQRYKIAESLEVKEESITFTKGHKCSPTCVAMNGSEDKAYSGGMDCAIIQWDLATMKKLAIFPGNRNDFKCGGHFQKVSSVCTGGAVGHPELLCSVGDDKTLLLWDVRAPNKGCVQRLLGHQSGIASVVCSETSAQAAGEGMGGAQMSYSGGKIFTLGEMDKALKVWHLDSVFSGRYVDSQYGHTNYGTCMDILQGDRPVTGGADGTVRYWKVANDTHMLFNVHKKEGYGSVDAVSLLDPEHILAGGQDGGLTLWATNSRRPVASVGGAHSARNPSRKDDAGDESDDDDDDEDDFNFTKAATAHPTMASDGQAEVDREVAPPWISSLASIRCSDVGFSGSNDGLINVWRTSAASKGKMNLDLDRSIKLPIKGGWINQMAVGSTGRVLVAAVGRNHRLGRWDTKPGRDGLAIVRLEHDGPSRTI
ncbi:pre-rRNA processing protein [Perkinsus olseni]|uniref:Pre-rRNA processing protein n=1 Tax=Perkinsus olseni TaxID=32597 RepID=A0A7J6MI72_PEROL|nr:pre-rRNA processing protein [Perkinsus olseni]